MRDSALRSLIRLIIESEEDVHSPEGDLLTEPDEIVDEVEAEEASIAASIGGGPAMPLGAGPSYPGPERRSRSRARREITRVTGDAFGGALPIKKK
jgi:hypothetical protein